MSEPTRRLGRAADIELKRRGVLSRDDELCSAEPEGFVYSPPETTADAWIQPRLDGIIELTREPELLSPAEREERALKVLGLTVDYDQPELPLQVSQIAEFNRRRQAQIDERRSMRIPAEQLGEMDLGEAWTVIAERQRAAIIQPPRPPIPAARQVLELAAERQAER